MRDHNRQTNKMNAELFIIKSTLQRKNIWQKLKLVVGLLLQNGKIYYDEYRFSSCFLFVCIYIDIFEHFQGGVLNKNNTKINVPTKNDVFIQNDPYVNRFISYFHHVPFICLFLLCLIIKESTMIF